MVTHGAKDNATRNNYAQLQIDSEKRYNPNGYPSFFVRDMNAREGYKCTKTYRTYWNDVYLELDAAQKSGPFSTFNGLDTSLDSTTGMQFH